MIAKASTFIKLFRIPQWVKNGFVFLPMFFGGKLLQENAVWISCIAFFIFSFASSAIYCFNDYMDAAADRLHPVKRLRPVASGVISRPIALLSAFVLAIISFAATIYLLKSLSCLLILSAYIILNIGYSCGLKKITILDVFIIAIGFVLRLWFGGEATFTPLSPWIVCMTFLLTLFLAFAKRRDDVILTEQGNKNCRESSRNYNLTFLNQTLGVLAAITIVCYLMFTVSTQVTDRIGSNYLYITSIFVIFGILRYLQIAIVMSDSGRPTRVLLRDRYIIISIVCWALTYSFFLYI